VAVGERSNKRKKREKKKRYLAERKKKAVAAKQTFVYVTGLPPKISTQDVCAYFSKCGVLNVDDDGPPVSHPPCSHCEGIQR
jgi:hypothetical protein